MQVDYLFLILMSLLSRGNNVDIYETQIISNKFRIKNAANC